MTKLRWRWYTGENGGSTDRTTCRCLPPSDDQCVWRWQLDPRWVDDRHQTDVNSLSARQHHTRTVTHFLSSLVNDHSNHHWSVSRTEDVHRRCWRAERRLAATSQWNFCRRLQWWWAVCCYCRRFVDFLLCLPLTSILPHLRCDVGPEGGEYWKKLSLRYSIVFCYNGAQRYEQFLQVGWLYRALILLGLAPCLLSASVSLVFMVLYMY